MDKKNYKVGTLPHPPEEILERYFMKICTPQEAEDLEDHLFLCECCQNRLENAGEWVSLLKMTLPMSGSTSASDSPASSRRGHSVPAWIPSAMLPRQPGLAFALAVVAVILAVSPFWLRYRSGPEQFVELASIRGGVEEASSKGSSNARLTLHYIALDMAGGPVEVLIVNDVNEQVFAQKLEHASDQIAIPFKLPPGQYWVRLKRIDGGSLLKETGLRVE